MGTCKLRVCPAAVLLMAWARFGFLVGFDAWEPSKQALQRGARSGADSDVAHEATGTGEEAEGTVEGGDQPASLGAAIDGP